MNATPELIDLHIKMADQMAIARTMVSSMNTGLDVSMRLTGTERRHFVSEVLASQEAYLDLYLRDLGPDGSS